MRQTRWRVLHYTWLRPTDDSWASNRLLSPIQNDEKLLLWYRCANRIGPTFLHSATILDLTQTKVIMSVVVILDGPPNSTKHIRPIVSSTKSVVSAVLFVLHLAFIRLIHSNLTSANLVAEKELTFENELMPLIPLPAVLPLFAPETAPPPKGSHTSTSPKPSFVVLLTCSYGFFQMWENWLAFFEKLEIPNLPVHLFAEDKITFERCMDTKRRLKNRSNENNSSSYEVDVSCLAWETVFTEPAKKRVKSAGWSRNLYVKMMSHRPFIIQKELEKGHNVIFSDVDALWLKSPLPYFEDDFYAASVDRYSDQDSDDVAKQINIWAQVDPHGLDKTNDYLCPGFVVYRSTPETIQFVQKWGNLTSHGDQLLRNQKPFNELMWRPQLHNISKTESKSLPINLFSNGMVYFENMTDIERKEVVVAHNNCIGGLEKKVQRFKNFNLWLLSE